MRDLTSRHQQCCEMRGGHFASAVLRSARLAPQERMPNGMQMKMTFRPRRVQQSPFSLSLVSRAPLRLETNTKTTRPEKCRGTGSGEHFIAALDNSCGGAAHFKSRTKQPILSGLNYLSYVIAHMLLCRPHDQRSNEGSDPPSTDERCFLPFSFPQ